MPKLPQKPAVMFKKRAARDKTGMSTRRTWISVCGDYKIVEVVSDFKLPLMYYANFRCDLPAAPWTIISKHRKRGPAEVACCEHARKRAQDG